MMFNSKNMSKSVRHLACLNTTFNFLDHMIERSRKRENK